MSTLFTTGVRPALDKYLTAKSEEVRDYGNYWSASSAGYCMRLNILKRLKIPVVPEIQEDALRTQRVFECGHIFHSWAQGITKAAGLSIAQELELQDEGLMIRGHIDDLVLIPELVVEDNPERSSVPVMSPPNLILYDYKTANSQSFNYKRDEIGHYHKMQLGTYMYMLRNGQMFKNAESQNIVIAHDGTLMPAPLTTLTEGRILTISKDDLRMREHQLMWSDELAGQIVDYWHALNGYWEMKVLPPCTCLEHDGGFLGKRSKKGKIYNPYFYNATPCSLEWVSQFEAVKEFISKGEK
jgi:hypothetical protein